MKQGMLNAETINSFKVAVISTFSNELAETSIENVANVIEAGILDDTSAALYAALLDTSAGVAGVRPYGLLNGAPTQASAGGTVEQIVTDLKFLTQQMIAMRAAKPVYVLNPLTAVAISIKTDGSGHFVFRKEIADGALFGVPLVISENAPADQIVAINVAALMIELGAPLIDMKDSPTLVMIDDDGVAPTIADTGGVTTAGSVKVSDAAGTTPPSTVISAFQQNEQALRFIQPTTWATVRPAVAYVSGVAY